MSIFSKKLEEGLTDKFAKHFHGLFFAKFDLVTLITAQFVNFCHTKKI